MINAATALYAVLGYPINYTRSPQIHNALFEKSGKNAVYIALPTEPSNLSLFVDFAKVYLKGFNITIPYKETILPYLAEIDISAKMSGAVNTVKIKQGLLTGYNTDGNGGRRALERIADIKGKNIVIKGSGGASRGLAAALCCDCNVYIDARNIQKTENLIKDLKTFEPKASLFIYSNQKADILINATPLGSNSQAGLPFSEKEIEECEIVYDAVYDPEETEFIKLAQKHKKPFVKGMDMLISQAELAQEIFFRDW